MRLTWGHRYAYPAYSPCTGQKAAWRPAPRDGKYLHVRNTKYCNLKERGAPPHEMVNTCTCTTRSVAVFRSVVFNPIRWFKIINLHVHDNECCGVKERGALPHEMAYLHARDTS